MALDKTNKIPSINPKPDARFGPERNHINSSVLPPKQPEMIRSLNRVVQD